MFPGSMEKEVGVRTIQKAHNYGAAIHLCMFCCVATKYQEGFFAEQNEKDQKQRFFVSFAHYCSRYQKICPPHPHKCAKLRY